MGTTTETRITSTQAKDAIYKAHSISSSATEIDGSINRDAQTIVLLGDSITAGNTGENILFTQTFGQFVWGNALSGHKFDLIYKAGIGGETSSQILARVESDVIAYNPSHCMFLCGMNDSSDNDGTILLKQNIIDIYNKLNNAGIFSFILTNTIRKNSNQKNQQALSVNKWMVEYFVDKPNCEIIDFCSALIDPTSLTAQPRANATRDDLHPSCLGGFLGGKVIAKHLTKYKSKYLLEASSYNDFSINTISKNRLINPLLLGTSGLFQGSTTGDIATSHRIYTASGSCVASKENRADGFGESQILTITADSASCVSRLECSTSGLLNAGDVVYAMCDVVIENAVNLNRIQLDIFKDNALVASCFSSAESPRTAIIVNEPINLTLVSGKYTLDTNSTLSGLSTCIRISAYFAGAGSAVVKIGRCSLIRLD